MRLVRFSHALPLLVLGALLCATVQARAQAVLPRGLSSADVVSGVFPGSDAGDCCWIGEKAQLRAQLPPGADELVLKVDLPTYAAQTPQTLRVQIDGEPSVERCCIGPGEHDLVVQLSPASRQGPVTITLMPQHTFVPKQLGINGDERKLSMMLREVGFVDSSTGEYLESSPLDWTSSRSHIPVVLVCAIAALLLTLWRPLFGLLALILADPWLFAFTYRGDMVTLPKLVLLGVAIGLLPRLGRLLTEKPGRDFYLLGCAQLVFALSMIPGTVLHAGPNATATISNMAGYVAIFAVGYVAYRLDPGERAVRITLAALVCLVAALGFAQPLFGGAETEVVFGHTFARAAGLLEGPNQLAGFFVITLPTILAFVVSRRAMIVEYAALGIGAVVALMTFSRGGVGALVFSCVVLFALRALPARRVLIATVTCFVLALAVAFGIFAGGLGGGVASLFGSMGGGFNGGLGSRLDLWHGAFAMWKSSPLFGIGAGNFEVLIGNYFPGVRTHANSMYFQVLAEQGIVGFVSLLAVFAASVGVFVRRLGEPLALAACVASIGLAFHDIADCMLIFPKVAVIWWLILAAGAASAERKGLEFREGAPLR